MRVDREKRALICNFCMKQAKINFIIKVRTVKNIYIYIYDK